MSMNASLRARVRLMLVIAAANVAADVAAAACTACTSLAHACEPRPGLADAPCPRTGTDSRRLQPPAGPSAAPAPPARVRVHGRVLEVLPAGGMQRAARVPLDPWLSDLTGRRIFLLDARTRADSTYVLALGVGTSADDDTVPTCGGAQTARLLWLALDAAARPARTQTVLVGSCAQARSSDLDVPTARRTLARGGAVEAIVEVGPGMRPAAADSGRARPAAPDSALRVRYMPGAPWRGLDVQRVR